MNADPKLPKFLSVENDVALFAPMAEMTLVEAVERISEAIVYCREHEIEGLLVDARELYGFPNPTVVDRYWFIRKWAEEAGSRVVLSMISRPDMMDPEQIGLTIAANAGLTANVFDNEPDARAWLEASVGQSTIAPGK